MSISVHQTLPSDMKKPILVTELKKLGVKNIESLSLEEMRNKFTELKMPLFAGRQKQMEKMVEDADQEAKKNKCKICGVPGGIKTMKEALIVFNLPGDKKEYYHIACAKNNNVMISSTDARKFLGPTLFGKKEHTAELPEAAGPNGQTRFFRLVDLEKVLEDEGKSVEDARTRIAKPDSGKGKGKRGYSMVGSLVFESTKKKKGSK